MVVTKRTSFYIALCLGILHASAFAAVLPEDRIDILYHNYTGGGITIDGPSVLVRKSIADQVSVSANYYVDNITSASIDAVTQASEYTENRVQNTLGIDYLHEKSTISYSYTSSIESDYDAITQSFGISQEMFGGLTTVNLGFSQGDNIVGMSTDPLFSEAATFKNYRTSVTQVLTKNLIMSLNYDIITDQGRLDNPYRQARVVAPIVNPLVDLGYAYTPEVYPSTRTTNAASFSLRYYLPYRAVIFGGYRYFTDSWNIRADTFEIGYVHPLEENWTFEFDFRYYTQTQASFYSDLAPNPTITALDLYARDKELSTFTDFSFGLGVTYEFDSESLPFFERGTANFFYNYIFFDYANFTDIRAEDPSIVAGEEPLYSFSSSVTRLYFSFWF